MNVALATGLALGDAVERRAAGLDLGQPLPSASDCGDQLDPGIGADSRLRVFLSDPDPGVVLAPAGLKLCLGDSS
jgi:hypothetical protein